MRGSISPSLPSRDGCRPSRSPACWRAAPRPIRLAVEPPARNVPAKPAGKPSRAISQRIARSSTKLPAVAHHRCDTATAWARSGGGGDVGRHRRDPAGEAGVADAQAVADDQLRELRQHGVAADAGARERLVERRKPAANASAPDRGLRSAGSARAKAGPRRSRRSGRGSRRGRRRRSPPPDRSRSRSRHLEAGSRLRQRFFLRRHVGRRRPRTAASTGSARRCRAACSRAPSPAAARSATWIAAASEAPPEMPAKMPSSTASRRDHAIASGPAIGSSSS